MFRAIYLGCLQKYQKVLKKCKAKDFDHFTSWKFLDSFSGNQDMKDTLLGAA